ncbi:MAG: energy-coupled thiamine transporter ThiT [Coriobacteriia bacterium]|nr:energy-coupled thiamine transporter ThiT [Coriobacteriia bacterium]
MRNARIRLIAEMGLAVALAVGLNAIFTLAFPVRMPFGGSFSLIMVPIVLMALMRGPWVGIAVGVLVGFSDLMFDPFVVSIPQMLLDYPIAYGLVGLAGIFTLRTPATGTDATAAATASTSTTATTKAGLQRLMVYAALGTIVGGLARLAAHVLSGVIFFGQYAPALQNVWVYSLVYNLTFMGPNIVAVAICATMAYPLVRRVVMQTEATQPSSCA